jgi:hypothetical protein
MLDQIRLDCFNACRRDLSAEWRLEQGGFSPVIYRDKPLSDSSYKAFPNLALAVWLASLVARKLVAYCLDAEAFTPAALWLRLEQLFESWGYSLRCPNLVVKNCAAMILIGLINEVKAIIPGISNRFPLGGDVLKDSVSSLRKCLGYIPTDRLKSFTEAQLCVERAAFPTTSELLQTLLELTCAIDQLQTQVDLACVRDKNVADNGCPPDASGEPIERAESACSWEVLRGSLLSDDGWETWTGAIRQNPAAAVPRPVEHSTERQDAPPELMPGCKVARQRRKISSPLPPHSLVSYDEEEDVEDDDEEEDEQEGEGEEEEYDEEAEKEDDDDAHDDSPADILSTGARRPQPSHSHQPHSGGGATETETEDLGTVIDIGSWNDQAPGSARLVQWEGGSAPEWVRWDADGGVFDVTHVRVKNGKVVARYPYPPTRLQQAADHHLGTGATYGIILRLRRISSNNKVESRGYDTRGILELPDFGSVVEVSCAVAPDGVWTIREEKLLLGPIGTGWEVRFVGSSWKAGTTYILTPQPSLSGEETDDTDRHCSRIYGDFSYDIRVQDTSIAFSGNMELQKSRLFIFDGAAVHHNIVLSRDKLTASKSGGSGQGCVFGSVGFTSGNRTSS